MSENSVLNIPWRPAEGREPLIEREWLITNGLGGYASGTLAGVSTRRYHGLLIANLPAPRGRTVLIPHLEEKILCEDNNCVILSGREESDGEFVNDAPEYLKSFRLEWLMPVWEYDCAGSRIEKRIIMPHGQTTVYIDYRLIDGPPVTIHLRPYFSMRGHDLPFLPPSREWPFTIRLHSGRFEVHPHQERFELKVAVNPSGIFTAEEREDDFFYRVEKVRGLDSEETMSSPGFFTARLEAGKPLGFLASTEPWESLPTNFEKIVEMEERRLEKFVQQVPQAESSPVMTRLVLNAEQFIALPGSRTAENMMIKAQGEHVRTVMAGYHWFTDWGRDTMISLEGLTLCTGRYDEAKAILRTFANYIHHGLLPNHFPEGQNQAIYNTADATFWYFHALDRYMEHTRDDETLRVIYPLLKNIMEFHLRGTDYGIGMDPRDHLIRASMNHYALTWMDAKMDDWVATPRRGKPVEIQGLWYNALCLMRDWSEGIDPGMKDFYGRLAGQVWESFNSRFWYAEGSYLYDVVDCEDGEDTRFRPNQIFTLSLRYSLLREDRARSVLNAVNEKLMTPYGLRTLDPAHKDFLPHYKGNRRARDGAYHQGLVWPWLTGHFYNAWTRVYGDSQPFQLFFKTMGKHLLEAGVGSISEIFDAEEPFVPRGCIAQAWSVAEILRMLWLEQESVKFHPHLNVRQKEGERQWQGNVRK